MSTKEKKARKLQKRPRSDISGRIASDGFDTMEAVMLDVNRAREFDEGGSFKRQTQSAPTVDDMATKKLNYQPNRPPPPRYQDRGPQQSQTQTTNTNF